MKNLLIIFGLFLVLGCQAQDKKEKAEPTFKLNKTDEEWKKDLSEEEYYILREKGTERPNTGEYNLHFEDGSYYCAACDQKLFDSDSKFESHCGWPSFDSAIEGAVTYQKDYSLGMTRTEILCSNCGGHLGHVFNDGPTATGKRYCVNSVSLDFENSEKSED